MMDWLNGKKTYAIGIAMIAYAASAFALGKIDGNAAIQLVLEALALMGLRQGVSTATKGKS